MKKKLKIVKSVTIKAHRAYYYNSFLCKLLMNGLKFMDYLMFLTKLIFMKGIYKSMSKNIRVCKN